MPSFKHIGKIGDVIFSLPVIEHMGGGVLYLELGGLLDNNSYKAVYSLLKNQDYIEDVQVYSGEEVDYDLAKSWFYKVLIENKYLPLDPMNNTSYYMVMFCGGKHDPLKRWIKPVPPIHIPGRDIAVYLSPRYLNSQVNWHDLLKPYEDRLFFVGLGREWVDFCRYSSLKLPYIPTKDYLELQSYLEGASRMFCGQGGIHALGEGIKMPMTVALDGRHDCLFEREDVNYLLAYD